MINFVIGIFALLGFFSVIPMAAVFNRMKPECFCDYDETPEAKHMAPRMNRRQMIICAVILTVVFALMAARFGLGVKSIALCLFSVILVMISVSDLRFCIIPDELLLVGCVIALVSAVPDVLAGQTLLTRLSPLVGGVIGGGMIFAINLLGRLLYKKDALGMGDLKLMAVCGIACGTGGIVIAMLAGVLAAGIWFAVGMALKRIESDSYLPLGPYLVFGTLFAICFRPAVNALLVWYLSLL